MRYTTHQLYKIDPKTFIGRPYDEVLVEKLEALIKRREELASQLKRALLNPMVNYGVVSTINHELNYIDGAEKDHRFLLDEMGVEYGR